MTNRHVHTSSIAEELKSKFTKVTLFTGYDFWFQILKHMARNPEFKSLADGVTG